MSRKVTVKWHKIEWEIADWKHISMVGDLKRAINNQFNWRACNIVGGWVLDESKTLKAALVDDETSLDCFQLRDARLVVEPILVGAPLPDVKPKDMPYDLDEQEDDFQSHILPRQLQNVREFEQTLQSADHQSQRIKVSSCPFFCGAYWFLPIAGTGVHACTTKAILH